MTSRQLQHEPKLSPIEVAEICNLEVQTVWKWLRTGRLRGKKIFRHWIVLRSDLDRLLEQSN